MYSDIAANKRKTLVIMAIFLVLLVGIVWLFDKYLGGSTGVFYGGLVGAGVYTLFSYYAGARMALAVNGRSRSRSRIMPTVAYCRKPGYYRWFANAKSLYNE